MSTDALDQIEDIVTNYTDIDTCDSEYDMEVLEEGYGSEEDG